MFWKKRIIIAFIIFALVLIVGRLYQQDQVAKVLDKLQEKATFAAEPLWNYDIESMGEYFQTVSSNNSYRNLEIFDEFGQSVLVLSDFELSKFQKLLIQLGILTETRFTKDIVYNRDVIGQIVIVWVDKSIYFYGYTTLIAILLYVISHLYLSTAEARTSLEVQFREAKKQKEYIEKLFDIIPEGLITLDHNNQELNSNQSFSALVAYWAKKREIDFGLAKSEFLQELIKQSRQKTNGQYSLSKNNHTIIIEYTAAEFDSYQHGSKLLSIRDVTRIKTLERQLLQAQKLESVGRLASGIAHEINTPTQYVITNINFLDEAIKEVTEIFELVEKLLVTPVGQKEIGALQKTIKERLANADWEFLRDELPEAIMHAKEGAQRISKIVQAMNKFSHPSGTSCELHDVNKSIENTVSIAKNEWKYVAQVELALDKSITTVPCYLDELNQVFLIMLVNSAHAINEKYGAKDPVQGIISITTQAVENNFLISFADNGSGITKKNVGKIFDPFFTTKDLGEGTGQGLAIAHDIIVEKHGGAVQVESELGQGTVFTISIPMQQAV